MASASRPATMVLMPITRPRTSARGPPEFPGARRTLACTQVREPMPPSGPTAWMTPVVSAPTKPSGLPIAMASSPGRSLEESAELTCGKSFALMRSAARSSCGSRDVMPAWSSRPSQSRTRAWGPPTTCALVTIRPSPPQMTPEPLPRSPASTRTVERRSCSATSPKPAMLMSVVSARTLGHRDGQFLGRATTHDLRGQCLADVFRLQMGLQVFEARDALAGQRNENVADHHSRFVCRASGFDFENDCAGFLLALQRMAKRLGQAHRLQADAKIAARNVALL